MSARALPRIIVVSPALADANNGNWQTARRWAAFLKPRFEVLVQREWDGEPADAMIALHARRSAPSIRSFAEGGVAPAVVLTGTDLYRDIDTDASAQHSLDIAAALVVLQPQGLERLAPRYRPKTRVIYQSAATLPAVPRRSVDRFDLVLAGHLRPEKDPLTALRALARLDDPALRLRHVGDMRDDAIGAEFRRAAASDSRIEMLGARSHGVARQFIRHADALVLPSLMEGGANVLIEAVTCGVPVLASRISGNLGMLGDDYDGYFEVGDDAALARLVRRCRDEPQFLDHLRAQCRLRAPLFEPTREAHDVVALALSLTTRREA